MITKLRTDIRFLALCLVCVSCFCGLCYICSDKVDAIYFSFMIYGILRFLNIGK